MGGNRCLVLGSGDRGCIGISGRGMAFLTGWRHGPGSAVSDKLPLWLIALIVFRAGVVSELFYRGYAIERLRMVRLGPLWSVIISLSISSFAHWSGGVVNTQPEQS